MLIFCEFGGLFEAPHLSYTPTEAAILEQALNSLKRDPGTYNSQLINGYLLLLNSQHTPTQCADIVEDLSCHYLGYSRTRKTKLIVRIREAIRVLLGKPSQAYFTNEYGDYADGMFKDAIRFTLKADQVRRNSEQVYACRTTPELYIIPVFKFLWASQIEHLSDQQQLLLQPFVIV